MKKAEQTRQGEVFTLKPGIWGISVDLKELGRRSWPLLQRACARFRAGDGTIQMTAFNVPPTKTTTPAIAPPDEKRTFHVPRYTTVGLSPVTAPQELYKLAEDSMEIVPHVLVDAPPAQMTMIEECLSLLNAVSQRRWSCRGPVTPDAHDETDFPDISRRRRLTDLFVQLKGHDIRIVASRETYSYPPGETPLLAGIGVCEQLVIAFAPPRGEYEEASVSVPFDGGRDFEVPRKSLW